MLKPGYSQALQAINISSVKLLNFKTNKLTSHFWALGKIQFCAPIFHFCMMTFYLLFLAFMNAIVIF